MLGYVRNSPLNLTNTSLKELVQNSIDKVSIPNDVKITISQKDVAVDCDSIKLDAVFINLIINSIQAIPNGGKIEIKISEKDNLAIIQFIDSGEGISEENMDKIFEPLLSFTATDCTGLTNKQMI